MNKVMIFILYKYCLLKQDEVICFLHHQVSNWIIFRYGSQSIEGMDDNGQEKDHEDIGVDDGKDLYA